MFEFKVGWMWLCKWEKISNINDCVIDEQWYTQFLTHSFILWWVKKIFQLVHVNLRKIELLDRVKYHIMWKNQNDLQPQIWFDDNLETLPCK